MANKILRPYSRGLSRGGVPSGKVQIDWKNGITRNLVSAYIATDGVGPVDLAFRGQGNSRLSNNGTMSQMATPDGPGWGQGQFDAGGGGIGIPIPAASPLLTATNVTIFARYYVQLLSVANGASTIFGINYDATNADPFIVWGILINGGGTGGTGGIHPGWNSAGTFVDSTAQTGTLVAGKIYSVVCTFTVNGNNNIYLDGVFKGAQGFGATGPTVTTTANISIGDNTNQGRTILGAVTAGYIWDRVLTLDEIVQISASPYIFAVGNEMPGLQAPGSASTMFSPPSWYSPQPQNITIAY